MKNISYFLFAALFSTNLGAQHLPQDELRTIQHHEWEMAYYGFQGEVKQCKLFHNDILQQEWAFAKGKGLEKQLGYEGDKMTYSADYTYNAQNLPVEAKLFHNFETAGELFQRGFHDQNSSLRFTFDKNGKLTEKLKDKKYKTLYDYDEQGRVTGIAYYTDEKVNSTYDYNYNENGQLLKQIGFHCSSTGNCDPYSNTVYTYASNGVETERSQSGYIMSDQTYSYDKNGRVVSSTFQMTLSGRLINSTTTYTYNDKNQLIKVESFGTNNDTTYEYEYDERGNWVKQLYWATDETNQKVLQSTNRREFVYF